MKRGFANTLLAASAITALLFFGATGLSGCAAGNAAGQWVENHVSTVGGSISVDPVTGAVTISGDVGIKPMQAAAAVSTAIQTQNNGGTPPLAVPVTNLTTGTVTTIAPVIAINGTAKLPAGGKVALKVVTRPVVNVCGQRGIVQTFEIKAESLWHRFLHMFDCECGCKPKPPATTNAPLTQAPAQPLVDIIVDNPTPPAAPVDPDTDAIIAQVMANDNNTLPAEKGNGDRAVVFGNNYPGTDAELHECVNDAKKNVVNLVKVDHFDPKNIRLFTNQQCTKSNYEMWSKWALVDGVQTALPDPATNTTPPNWGRRAWFNSSHGAEDTDANGKVIQVLVTDDMVRKGQWDTTTEVTFDFWYALLRTTQHPWMMLNDSCHSGGQTRLVLSLVATKGRAVRSLDGPAAVQARLNNATTRSTAMADLGKLTGTVFAVCLPNELASEGPDGGVGTNAYWNARKKLPANSKAGDYVKECNRLFHTTNESQHFTLVGVNTPLWQPL